MLLKDKIETEKKIESLIYKINNLTIKNAKDNFAILDRVFSFFYSKKVYLKKIKNPKEKENLKDILSKLNTQKVEDIFHHLENLELLKEASFENIEGINLLRRVKAKYFYSKRFFLEDKK